MGLCKQWVEKQGEHCMGEKNFVSCATSDSGLELLLDSEGIDHNSGSYREL